VAISYLDLIKDSSLVVQMMSLIVGSLLTAAFPTVVSWILLTSILVPLIATAIGIDCRCPRVVPGLAFWRENTPPSACLRATILAIFPAVPAIVISSTEEAKAKLDEVLETCKVQFDIVGEVKKETTEELAEVTKYIKEVRRATLIFKRNEFSLEIIVQLTLQTTMLLLSTTGSLTHSGSLRALFKEEESNQLLSWLGLGHLNFGQFYLIASILWSFKTAAITFLKIQSEQKGQYLPATAKVVLGLRALLTCSVRIGCMVAFHGPFLGLMDVLSHWTAEQKSLDPDLFARLNQSTFFTDIYRSNPTPQPYTAYTLIELHTALSIFLGLLLLQGLITMMIKRWLSPQFLQADWGSRLQHVVETLSIPTAFRCAHAGCS
jgi:hypothetical protein